MGERQMPIINLQSITRITGMIPNRIQSKEKTTELRRSHSFGDPLFNDQSVVECRWLGMLSITA